MVIELTDGFYTLPDIVVSNLWIFWIDRKRYAQCYLSYWTQHEVLGADSDDSSALEKFLSSKVPLIESI
jgi:hypothetical protein